MAINVSNPQDLTGREKARLEAETKAQREAAAKTMSMVTATASEPGKDVISLATGTKEVAGPDGVVTVKVPKKKMRVNTVLEQVTIGHGTNYNFVPGQYYEVDEDVYNYLDEREFVWH